MRTPVLIAPLVLAGVLGAARAEEPWFGTGDRFGFAVPLIACYADAAGSSFRDVDITGWSPADRAAAKLQKWHEDYQMMQIALRAGEVCWVKRADLVPPPELCRQGGTEMVAGGDPNRQTAGSRALAEKLCG